MKILPATNINHNTRFGDNHNFTKKFLNAPSVRKSLEKNVKEVMALGSVGAGAYLSLDERLKLNGITYCNADDNTITVGAGYNGGFCKIKTTHSAISNTLAKEYVLAAIKSKGYFGGVTNYMDMIKGLKRQDIIQKGLRIHTYEINSNILAPDASNAAARLSKFTKKAIRPEDLFFFENDAYYYDMLERTAYGINTDTINKVLDNNTVLVCKFLLNDKRNPIGYNCSYWDVYTGRRMNKQYIEQQAPSIELKEIAEPDNLKEFAEAFRFGNTSQKNYSKKIKEGIPNVLKHLSEKIGVKEPKEEELQVVRFYDKDSRIKSRICYYDSTIGCSFVYNEDGKYMYQLEYNKDSEGNITFSNRI